MLDALIFMAWVLGTIGVGAFLGAFLFAFITAFKLVRNVFSALEAERKLIP